MADEATITTEHPIHPVTGLRALGIGKRGPIWPVIGGNGEGGDPPTDPNPPADPPSDPPAAPPKEPAQDPKAEGTDWKAEARKWETRAKENSKAADELDKIKRSKMDDQQKAQADAQAATERAEKAERRAALAEAGVTHGLTKADLELLDGVPADQIEDRAKKLAARIKQAAPAGASGREAGGGRGNAKPTTLEGAISKAYGG